MGTQRLAELRDHRVAPAGNILVCTEVSKFAGGVGLTEVERGVCNCLEEQIAVQDALNFDQPTKTPNSQVPPLQSLTPDEP